MTDQEINAAIAKVVGKKANYCHNLNAVHKAEETLSDGQAMEFERQLRRLPYQTYRYIISATARQRTEAFLRTKGLWKE